jgi:hypothetical protein
MSGSKQLQIPEGWLNIRYWRSVTADSGRQDEYLHPSAVQKPLGRSLS